MSAPQNILVHTPPTGQPRYYSLGTPEKKDIAARAVITRLISTGELPEPVVVPVPEFLKDYSQYGDDYWDYLSDDQRNAVADYAAAMQNAGVTYPAELEMDLADYTMAKSVANGEPALRAVWVRPVDSTLDEWKAIVAKRPNMVDGMLVTDDGVYEEVSPWNVLRSLPQMGETVFVNILDAEEE